METSIFTHFRSFTRTNHCGRNSSPPPSKDFSSPRIMARPPNFGRHQLHSSFKDINIFLSAWYVYIMIHRSHHSEHFACLIHWTERINQFHHAGFPWHAILSYITRYFQSHQNAPRVLVLNRPRTDVFTTCGRHGQTLSRYPDKYQTRQKATYQQ